MQVLNYNVIHPSWREHIERGLKNMDSQYLQQLTESTDWLPGPDKIFSAFSQPFDNVNYILFGESPYPRRESANGYAFWDAAVADLWSPTGLSKKVNRATSLRNIMKMLMIADGKLTPDNTSQDAIARADKSTYVQSSNAFFQNLLHQGFLLLNATPVLRSNSPPQIDAKAWQPFIKEIMQGILCERPAAKLILFGKIAQAIDPLIADKNIATLHAEHPYNLSFINNRKVIEFFQELHLLDAT